ncbi:MULTISPECIES: energy transducer TonB [Microbulbifer]|nr:MULTISPECIES: energy transducer TonB [Microbulbifer]KUJ83653.1 hypothetical protein AVO43_07340 [Microbulbifer sp. ZGT114]
MDRAYLRNPITVFTVFQPLLRSLSNWMLAAIVTLLLLLAMSQLITKKYTEPDTDDFVKVENIHLPDLKPTVQKFEPPVRVQDPQQPPPMLKNRTRVEESTSVVKIAAPVPGGEFEGPVLSTSGPVPIFKPAPRYPASALRRGIEGYVVVEFSIGKSGSVQNAVVIGGYDSAGNATEIFNRAALAAVQRFKYRPQMEDGRAVIRHGVRNRIRFKLAE